jgi:hypothetical protein
MSCIGGVVSKRLVDVSASARGRGRLQAAYLSVSTNHTRQARLHEIFCISNNKRKYIQRLGGSLVISTISDSI